MKAEKERRKRRRKIKKNLAKYYEDMKEKEENKLLATMKTLGQTDINLTLKTHENYPNSNKRILKEFENYEEDSDIQEDSSYITTDSEVEDEEIFNEEIREVRKKID